MEYKGAVYETELFIKPNKVADSAPKERKSTAYTPPDTHYYKYGQSLFKQVTFEGCDQDILEMLCEISLGKYKKMA
ncbi:hypothetical protein [Calorimonas adulescens]|uniref:Uncharacterized protein n=1 Tax=Calorimonas adulescens TaxID=2606906 RepID=A0A5D8QFL5_9THEO|nr:hypothetical protein [Calorimonas adulescens]TZE83490.1 hypothetical protein FWJ32_00980 [Calorimonas adulescens]